MLLTTTLGLQVKVAKLSAQQARKLQQGTTLRSVAAADSCIVRAGEGSKAISKTGQQAAGGDYTY